MTKKKYTRGEIIKIILKSLVAGVFIVTVLALPGLGQVYTLFKPKNAYENRRIKRTLNTLQKQKMVRIYTKNGKEVVKITQNGKKQVLAYNLQDMQIQKQKKWDGYWRIIISDIPENKRNARKSINIKLKNMNFYHLQKSTFILPYPCKREVDFIGEYFNVRKNIIYIKAKEIENTEQLKKYFKLV